FSSTPAYLHRSPALEGTRRLSLVDVGAGDPDDYEGKDVDGKVVLIDSPDDDYEGRTATAAAAGAALAIIVVPPGGHAWAVWQPLGDRLPTMSVLVTREEGAQLKDLLAAGR